MEQPWPQPQESAPDSGDLPLAGLLAELLAASETESAPPPADDPVAALSQPAAWPENRPEEGLDAPDVLRALDEAAPPASPDTDPLSGMLLARLIGDAEPAGEEETAAGAGDESGLTASGAAGPADAECAGLAAAEFEVPVGGEAGPALPAATAGDLSAALLDRLMEEGQAGTAAETAEIDADEPQILAPGGSTHPEQPVMAEDEPWIVPARLAEDGAAAPIAEDSTPAQAGGGQPDDQQAGPVVADAATSAALEPVAQEPPPGGAGETGPAAILAEPEAAATAEAGVSHEGGQAEAAEEAGVCRGQGPAAEAEDRAGAARMEPSEVPAAAGRTEGSTDRPGAQHSAVPASDEDEFELVDAAQAEKMLDRLLDAARSAIRSTQAPAPGGALPGSVPAAPSRPKQAGEAEASELQIPPETAVGREPAGFSPAETCDAAVAAPQTPPGEPGLREPSSRRAAEERTGEVSPIPPAAALMALGLPERLRARLESLGDVEQILQGQKALEPALEQKPRLLVFRAGGESYALSMDCVREVERVSRVTPVPGAPEFVRGLVNLRGEILPLLDLAALFGQKAEPPAPRLIVAQASSADPLVALLVEELNGLAPFYEDRVEPPPQPGRLRGSLEHRGRRVWWIDPEAVFGAEALEKAAGGAKPGGMEEGA